MPRKIYYKVVRKENDKRVSIWAEQEAQLEYPPMELIEANPMSAGIFVFVDKKSAKAFCAKAPIEEKNPIIIKCYGIGPVRRFKEIVDSYRDLIIYWFYVKSWGPETPKQEVPPGTVCFNAVQLLE